MLGKVLPRARKLFSLVPGFELAFTNFDAETGALTASVDISADNLTGTQQSTFSVNDGASTPTIQIGGGAGTGDYTLSLISPTIAADVTLTAPATTGTLAVLGANSFTAAQIVASDDTTDGVVDLLTMTHSSSDDNATAGDGVGISFKLENATGTSTVEEWASIDVKSAVITNGSEDADIVISAMLAGTVTAALTLDASDESWTIGADATNANGINGLRIYPQTASKGSMLVRATANTGDSVLTITNAALGQATTLTYPDPGNATADFLLTYGDQTVNGSFTFAADTLHEDDIFAGFGTGNDAEIGWQTSDADAQALVFGLGDPTSTVVPAAVFGAYTQVNGVDLGLFDGLTQPLVTVVDADGDTGVGLTFSADDVPAIQAHGQVAVICTLPQDSGQMVVQADTATTHTGAGAVPITHGAVACTTGAGGEAWTLADGTAGQELLIYLATDGGGNGTLTPDTTFTGFATIVFADAGDAALLRFVGGTVGWIIVALYGVAAPPAITV